MKHRMQSETVISQKLVDDWTVAQWHPPSNNAGTEQGLDYLPRVSRIQPARAKFKKTNMEMGNHACTLETHDLPSPFSIIYLYHINITNIKILKSHSIFSLHWIFYQKSIQNNQLLFKKFRDIRRNIMISFDLMSQVHV